uniref:Ovule protein n=1 Tax=Caenorhabditis tropicalis TaxID=1561998 RepID=A0A1I7SXE2_9PELO
MDTFFKCIRTFECRRSINDDTISDRGQSEEGLDNLESVRAMFCGGHASEEYLFFNLFPRVPRHDSSVSSREIVKVGHQNKTLIWL